MASQPACDRCSLRRAVLGLLLHRLLHHDGGPHELDFISPHLPDFSRSAATIVTSSSPLRPGWSSYELKTMKET